MVYRELNVTSNEQKLIHGGSKSAEKLWSGYANGTSDIGISNGYKNWNGDYIVFSEFKTVGDGINEDRVAVGAIDLRTGKRATRDSGGDLDW